MANRPSPDEKIFKERVNNLRSAIHNVCTRHVSNKIAFGYIFRDYDSEFHIEGYQGKEELYIEYKREVVKPKYGSIQVGKRSACQGGTIADNSAYVQKLVNAVKPMLIEDGFKTIQIEVVPYKQCYDIVKQKPRLLTTDYWRERQYTDENLGYIVKFLVTW